MAHLNKYSKYFDENLFSFRYSNPFIRLILAPLYFCYLLPKNLNESAICFSQYGHSYSPGFS